MNWQERSALLLGEEGIARLARANVLVFGLGGVGSYCVEALARGGVGRLTLVDGDVFAHSNRNRQLSAYCSTVGRSKAEVTKERIADINPDCQVKALNLFYLGEGVDFAGFDYVVDCVDTVTAKLAILEQAAKAHVPVITCLGTGNKLHPECFRIDLLERTSVCPLAKVMRHECKKRNLTGIKALYSTELPVRRGEVVGSVSYVPGVAGLLIAGEVLQSLV